MDMENVVDKATLKGAVQQTIFCESTGVILDVKTTVLCEITFTSGNVKRVVVHADAWEAGVKSNLGPVRQHPQVTGVKVYDGRELFGGAPNRRRKATLTPEKTAS